MKQETKIVIIAEPNGAGKTTFAREFLSNEASRARKQRMKSKSTVADADLSKAGLVGREIQGEVVLLSRLRAALERLNPALLPAAITAACISGKWRFTTR